MPVYLQYYFWLIAISLFCFTLERIFPWRKQQKILRKGIWQDLVWLIFSGHYLGLIIALIAGKLILNLNSLLYELGLPVPESIALLSDTPLWQQFVIFFVIKDFIEWNVHRMLHIVPWLWEFHKLHHSIEELDWIGNFRFHWGEVIVYKTILYLPMVILGVNDTVILIIAVTGTLMQDLNHANLRVDWGPLRYIFNSPKMHVWHHDVDVHGRGGQNFGIVLSIWDWLFGTVYWPGDRSQPHRFGFKNMEVYPKALVTRFFYPFLFRK
jgi:sterol desaturase/sphingolipid hydroxylase (fatty acid hydroxylase superfamily)